GLGLSPRRAPAARPPHRPEPRTGRRGYRPARIQAAATMQRGSDNRLSFHCPSACVRRYLPCGPLTTPTFARLPFSNVKKVLLPSSIEATTWALDHVHLS